MGETKGENSGDSSATKWLKKKGRKATRMAGLKDAGVFDKLNYWHWIEALGNDYFDAPSGVKEILPIKGRRFAVVVCRDGNIILLKINGSDNPPNVMWRARVAFSLANDSKPVKVT